MSSDLVVGLALGVALNVVAAISVIGQSPKRRKTIAVLVGISAALEGAQVAKVHIFVIVVGFFFAVARPSRPKIGRAALIVVCAGVMASTVLYGPLVNTRATGIQLVLFALAAGGIAAVAERDDIKAMMVGVLVVSTVAAVIAIVQYVGLLPLALLVGQRRPTAFIYSEPDYLGLFTAVGILVALRMGRQLRVTYLLVAVNGIAMILASARASWLGLFVAIVVSILCARRGLGQDRNATRVVLSLAGVILVLFIVDPSLRTYTVSRIESAVSGPLSSTAAASDAEISAQARRNQQASLLQLAQSAPWYGQGLTASGRVQVYGGVIVGTKSPNNLGSNWILSWWLEGKYLAIPLIVLFIVAAIRRIRDPAGALLVLLLVNNLFSNASLQPLTWFALGIALAGSTKSMVGGQEPSGANASLPVESRILKGIPG